MTKTLALILNYNYPEITDPLFESLLRYVDDTHVLGVLDNCSDVERRSKYTTHQSDVNGYFGGGLSVALHEVATNPAYDSLLFLSNDLVVDTFPLVQPMREIMFRDGYHLLGASVHEPPNGTTWRQTRPWGSPTPRPCRWFDIQCPLIHKELCIELGAVPDTLKYGWGIDLWMGIVTEDKGWKTAMLDTVQVTHMGDNHTFKNNRASMTTSEYVNKCMNGMHTFFDSHPIYKEKYDDMRRWAEQYHP